MLARTCVIPVSAGDIDSVSAIAYFAILLSVYRGYFSIAVTQAGSVIRLKRKSTLLIVLCQKCAKQPAAFSIQLL